MQSLSLETPRLRLQPFEPQDWRTLYAYTSDADVMAFIPEGCFTPEMAQAFIDGNREEAEAHALILKAENRLIGHMVFHEWFTPRVFEIGWVLHADYHRRGYATEAAEALLAYGFEILDAHRIIATCQPENVASYRVMEKLGMRREGHFRKCVDQGDGLWWDEYVYAMLEEEWFGRVGKRP